VPAARPAGAPGPRPAALAAAAPAAAPDRAGARNIPPAAMAAAAATPAPRHRDRDYCAKGTTVHYEQYDALSHICSVPIWLVNSIAWIKQRFAGLPAPQNCSSISEGNPLKPIPVPPTASSHT